jgi:signal transduction histidine kinase/CheY-like chemotaxis protein
MSSDEVFEANVGSVPGDGQVIVFHDITNRIHAEEMLRKSVAEAEAANRAKSSFLATMSHELRTPMNGILGMTRVLAHTPLDEEQGAYLDTIRASGEHLVGIINDVLDLSKIESGHMEIESVEYKIGDLANEVTTLLAPTARAKGIDIASYIDPRMPGTLRGDPLRVRQLITNLIGNAIKFTERGGVSLLIDRFEDNAGSYLRIKVRDTGIGIPEDKRERLFKRFSQVDASTTRNYGGTGLGLALCRELSTLMGGTIDCESRPGSGSTFSVLLPLMVAQSTNEAPAGANSRALSGWKFLLIGEEGPLADVLRNYARSAEATMDLLPCGPNVLQRLGSHNNTCILLDCGSTMHVRDDLVRKISGGHPGLSTPFFIVTDAASEAQGLDVPADTLLPRPFGRESFERICNRLRRHTPVREIRPAGATVSGPQHNLRVLMAEDNEPNQRVARAILRGAGFAIDIAINGNKAVELVADKGYDVVLMDVNMPIMDGLEATQIIRQTDVGRVLPIIGLTASVMDGDRQRCLEAGMNDHLAKPIDWDALIALLNRMDSEIYGGRALAS